LAFASGNDGRSAVIVLPRPNALNARVKRAEPAVIATPEDPNRAENRCAGLRATNPLIRYVAASRPNAADKGPCAASGKLDNPV
jgi:hypothetical protein